MQFWNFIFSCSYQSSNSTYDLISITHSPLPFTVLDSPYLPFFVAFLYPYLHILSQLSLDFILGTTNLVVNSLTTGMVCALIVSLKFIALIALLVFIRGGIPRYRFDHLTKIGWIKFLSLVLASILVEMLLVWLL